VGVAHLAVQLGLGDERGDGVDHQDVDGAGADEGLDDFERLLAVVGLGDEEVVDIHSEFFGVGGIERVLGIDEGSQTAGLLRLGDDLQRDGGLAGGLGAEDLNDAAARDTAYSGGRVEGDGAGGDDGDGADGLLGAEAHDGAFAKLLFQCCECGFYCFVAVIGHGVILLGGKSRGILTPKRQ